MENRKNAIGLKSNNVACDELARPDYQWLSRLGGRVPLRLNRRSLITPYL